MLIYERMKFIRESLGLTQRGMGARIGISYRTWQDYETAKSYPNSKTLKQLAKLGFNVNWILTGERPVKLSEGEKAKLSYEDAHRYVRKQIRTRLAIDRIIMIALEKYDDDAITREQLISYTYDRGYIPTPTQLLGILRILRLTDDEIVKPLFDTDIRLSASKNKINTELLQCSIEAIEDEKFKFNKIDAKKKAKLVSFIYSANLGTSYTIEKLKQFLESTLIIVDQLGGLEDFFDAKIDDVIFKISHLLVKDKKNR